MKRLPPVAVLAASLSASLLTALFMPAQAATTRAVGIHAYAAYAQVGAETTLIGSVTSSPPGSQVKIQELRSESWIDVGSVGTDADGGYRYSFVLSSAGTKSYRAVAPATTDLDQATSPTASLAVKSAPTVPFDAAPTPAVAGTQAVGSIVAAVPGTWSPTPSAFQYRWIRDGVPIRAWGRRYQVTSDDLGKHLTVAVGAYRSDALTIRESKPGGIISRGTFTTQPPVITGTAVVGKAVTADVSKWVPQPTTLRYQWKRNQTPITGATNATYTLAAEDAATDLSVDVSGEGAGMYPVTRSSAVLPVPGSAPTSDVTFGSLMHPRSTSVLPSSAATFTATHTTPTWSNNKLVRWDQPGAFTHSLVPHPVGTITSAYLGYDISSPSGGAEYTSTSSTYKNADVEFNVIGRTFAIKYKTYSRSDAMVWIDDRPVSASPILGWDESGSNGGSRNWITITLSERRTVKVRFAGPIVFTGVDSPAADNVTVTATPAPFTIGVIGDSFYEKCGEAACLSRSGAPTLSTLTGFRVWNIAEWSTGYLSNGSGVFGSDTGMGRGAPGHETSKYGSARRLAAIRDAPLDALLVNGTVNDRSAWTSEQHLAAVDAFLDDVEQVRPDLPVVLVGVEPLYYARAYAARVTFYRALTANLASRVGRHKNVVGFIDPYTEGWLTGSGTVSSPKGDGNQDLYIGSDGVHPTGAGQLYYEGRIVEQLKNLPVPVTP